MACLQTNSTSISHVTKFSGSVLHWQETSWNYLKTLENETSTACSKSKYEDIKEYVNNSINKEIKLVSVKLLHKIYRLGIGHKNHRYKLKYKVILLKDITSQSTEYCITQNCDISWIIYCRLLCCIPKNKLNMPQIIIEMSPCQKSTTFGILKIFE